MKKVIVIVGPTGIGKTKLSIELAKQLNGEIINSDSTQVYQGLSIATAKIKEKEKENIPHHLLDICSIEKEYTVYDFQRDCRKRIDEILSKNKTPILVGGTGLYIKAALYDYHFEDEEVTICFDSISDDDLYQKLVEVDPTTDIHPHNRKRIERALQYYEMHQNPLSQKEKANTLLYDCLFIGLSAPREVVYERINKRVDKMLEDGLLDEAQRIYESGIRTRAVLTPIGYKELFSYFEGNKTLEECLEEIKQKSRKYAKRQDTWNRHQFSVKEFQVDFKNFENTVKEVMEYVEEES